ncbi:MAG TPA: hypothetical protein VFU26_04180 [Gaiellaceae bacterium]|nr:hypothetical protein [Gaiellaceae bacterium]
MRVASPFIAWATLLTVLAAVLWVWSSDHLPPAIFTAAAGVAWIVALAALLRLYPLRVGAGPELSFAGVLLALGIAMLALGALVGEWLVLIGAGTLLAGLAGVAVEVRSQRRAR